MSEIEKLYRNCGIENYRLENYYGFVPDGYIIIDDENREGYVKEIVRDFTAEKQLELIKWLSINYLIEFKKIDSTQEYYIGVVTDNNKREWWASVNFENALAAIINNLWQDLTEDERKQIKNILESEVRE